MGTDAGFCQRAADPFVRLLADRHPHRGRFVWQFDRGHGAWRNLRSSEGHGALAKLGELWQDMELGETCGALKDMEL